MSSVCSTTKQSAIVIAIVLVAIGFAPSARSQQVSLGKEAYLTPPKEIMDAVLAARTENFTLVGGSEETHEHMQEVSIRFNESLEQRGKPLAEASVPEVVDLMRKALDQ